MSENKRKYPAYPLITCDPYFSVWSTDDNLNGDFTRHWTGEQHSVSGIVTVDGVSEVFMGKMYHAPQKGRLGPKNIKQKSVIVSPLKTEYVFENEKIRLTVSFVTPLLLNDLKLLSRPVSYINYSIKSLDKKRHDVRLYFDVSALLAVNEKDEKVKFGKTDISIWMGRGDKDILEKKGDDLRIDWGYVHLAAPGFEYGVLDDRVKKAAYAGEKVKSLSLFDGDCELKAGEGEKASYPAIYCQKSFEVANESEGFVCIAYDDIHSLVYFGRKVDAYYKKDGEGFYFALDDAIKNHDEIMKKTESFEKTILEDAKKVSDDYADIVSIAYRQAVAAHKCVFDGEKGLFVSKECFSNGCAATVDVTYPSIPLFLKYNPDLVEYMLNPIFDFAARDEWKFDYAPHDVGTYPILNGQAYGLSAGELMHSMQMPIEECGNMILCVAALCRAKNSTEYAKKHMKTLKKWADYLKEYGYDPENQLCTDDFAGHLAHNCNLSVKAIMGIAAFGMILTMQGKENEGNEYTAYAKEKAKRWKKDAFDKNCYRLAFDKENSWSIKYNLVWDKLFKLGIFDDEIFETEVACYKTKINEYGVPLDCRSDYTKSDWQMWSTVLTEDKEYRDKIISAMLKMLSDTGDRVPFTDWYFTKTAHQRGFQNRTVQGGLFVNLLSL